MNEDFDHFRYAIDGPIYGRYVQYTLRWNVLLPVTLSSNVYVSTISKLPSSTKELSQRDIYLLEL